MINDDRMLLSDSLLAVSYQHPVLVSIGYIFLKPSEKFVVDVYFCPKYQ